MKGFFKYFARGVLFITPLAVTILLVMSIYQWVVERLERTDLHGLALFGIILGVLALVWFVGLLGTSVLAKPVKQLIESLIKGVPLVNFIYTSLKDVMGAVVGDKKKFDRPVLVTLTKDSNLQKPGFITQDDLSILNLKDKVAVYLPHSYNFSGNVFLVDKENVHLIDAPGGDIMKFIVSGGITGLEGLKAGRTKKKKRSSKAEL